MVCLHIARLFSSVFASAAVLGDASRGRDNCPISSGSAVADTWAASGSAVADAGPEYLKSTIDRANQANPEVNCLGRNPRGPEFVPSQAHGGMNGAPGWCRQQPLDQPAAGLRY
jgi:hypothetical protein